MEPRAHVRLAKHQTVLIGGTNGEMQRECSLTWIRNLYQKIPKNYEVFLLGKFKRQSMESLHVTLFKILLPRSFSRPSSINILTLKIIQSSKGVYVYIYMGDVTGILETQLILLWDLSWGEVQIHSHITGTTTVCFLNFELLRTL